MSSSDATLAGAHARTSAACWPGRARHLTTAGRHNKAASRSFPRAGERESAQKAGAMWPAESGYHIPQTLGAWCFRSVDGVMRTSGRVCLNSSSTRRRLLPQCRFRPQAHWSRPADIPAPFHLRRCALLCFRPSQSMATPSQMRPRRPPAEGQAVRSLLSRFPLASALSGSRLGHDPVDGSREKKRCDRALSFGPPPADIAQEDGSSPDARPTGLRQHVLCARRRRLISRADIFPPRPLASPHAASAKSYLPCALASRNCNCFQANGSGHAPRHCLSDWAADVSGSRSSPGCTARSLAWPRSDASGPVRCFRRSKREKKAMSMAPVVSGVSYPSSNSPHAFSCGEAVSNGAVWT